MSAVNDANELFGKLSQCNDILAEIEKRAAMLGGGGTGGSGGGGGASDWSTGSTGFAGGRGGKIEKLGMTAQQFTRVLYRMNHVMSHMGLGDDVNSAIGQLQRAVFMARMLQMSLNFLSMSTPYGWIMGFLGLFSVTEAATTMSAEQRTRRFGY